MSKDDRNATDWPAIVFILVGLPTAFTIGGFWVGMLTFVIGAAALGWSKRYHGPIPK